MTKNERKKDGDSAGDLGSKTLPLASDEWSLKLPSSQLQELLKGFAQNLDNLFDKWEKIKLLGTKEGFSESQLIQMVRPYLKKRGLSKDQIYYLFHRNQQKERVRRSKLMMKDNKNDTVKSLNAPNVPRKGNIVHYQDLLPDTSRAQANTSSVAKEVEMMEFDLGSSRDLLIRLIERTENEGNRGCIVRFYVKEGLLTAIKIEENGFFQEISLPSA